CVRFGEAPGHAVCRLPSRAAPAAPGPHGIPTLRPEWRRSVARSGRLETASADRLDRVRGWRLRKHPILESETASIVQEILQPIRAAVARRYRLLRRWLAATRTGQSQPAPEFDEPRRRLQACNFSPLR